MAAAGLASGWLVAAAATIAEVATSEEATSRPKRLPVSDAAAAIAARKPDDEPAPHAPASLGISGVPHWAQKRTAGP